METIATIVLSISAIIIFITYIIAIFAPEAIKSKFMRIFMFIVIVLLIISANIID